MALGVKVSYVQRWERQPKGRHAQMMMNEPGKHKDNHKDKPEDYIEACVNYLKGRV